MDLALTLLRACSAKLARWSASSSSDWAFRNFAWFVEKKWFDVNLHFNKSVILAAVELNCSKEPILLYLFTFVIKSVIRSKFKLAS